MAEKKKAGKNGKENEESEKLAKSLKKCLVPAASIIGKTLFPSILVFMCWTLILVPLPLHLWMVYLYISNCHGNWFSCVLLPTMTTTENHAYYSHVYISQNTIFSLMICVMSIISAFCRLVTASLSHDVTKRRENSWRRKLSLHLK